MKNRGIAAILAFFLGTFGIHKFYLGRPFQGLLYLLFCWTAIPGVLGVIEAILYLLTTDDDFHQNYG
ncbi:MAG: hypothetical protein A2020_11405 [Lentisphaerae bacterium GWF2_45_14]|nr:MAG: hypothetical protein A2020_11405 [Lentisphaerae bacterium GWF2_45_14]